MTTANFRHIDTSSLAPGTRPWTKVDVDVSSFARTDTTYPVTNLRDAISSGKEPFDTDTAGFALYHEPAAEKLFVDDAAIRGGYYDSVESLVRRRLSSTSGGHQKVKKVVIFDHTIRRRLPGAARAPVQSVHVDQTPAAVEVRVRRHVPDSREADELLKGRYQIVNVWRPIENPASDHPLAVVDWRTTKPEDFVPVDLLYPIRGQENGVNGTAAATTTNGHHADDDDRGKEVRPEDSTHLSTTGYEVKGETMAVRASPDHKLYYVRDMTPDEVLLLKCYDSYGDSQPGSEKHGEYDDKTKKHSKRIAVRTPHTAFEDPNTPEDAKPRQSIEVRCLVFYE